MPLRLISARPDVGRKWLDLWSICTVYQINGEIAERSILPNGCHSAIDESNGMRCSVTATSQSN